MKSLGYLTGSAETKASYGPDDDPKNLIALDQQMHQVTELYEKKKYDEAIALAEKVVAQQPMMRIGYVQLAVCLQSKGDPKAAIRVYEKATAMGAGGERMDRRRALLLSEAGRSKEAVAILLPYRESEDSESLNTLGIALADSGRAAEALPVFQRAMEIDPSGADAYQNTGIALLKLDKPDEARKNLEKALELGKRHTRAWNALGVAWMQLGAPEKAVAVWKHCVELNPEQYDALYNIGRVSGQLGDWKTARAALERFVATAPPAQYKKDIADVRAALADMTRRGV